MGLVEPQLVCSPLPAGGAACCQCCCSPFFSWPSVFFLRYTRICASLLPVCSVSVVVGLLCLCRRVFCRIFCRRRPESCRSLFSSGIPSEQADIRVSCISCLVDVLAVCLSSLFCLLVGVFSRRLLPTTGKLPEFILLCNTLRTGRYQGFFHQLSGWRAGSMLVVTFLSSCGSFFALGPQYAGSRAGKNPGLDKSDKNDIPKPCLEFNSDM